MQPTNTQLWAQNRLENLRMASYCGTQFYVVLGSVLVFQMTGSAAWAGLALAIEFLPKLLMYLCGGSLAQRWGHRRAHVGSEICKLLALVLVWLCAAGQIGPWALAVAGALAQCSNAISNIVFEMSVTKWWAPTDRPAGHAALMQRDNWACFAALGIGWAWGHALGMASVATVIGALSVWWTVSSTNTLYAVSLTDRVTNPGKGLGSKIVEDLRAASKKPLLGFALSGFLLGIPTALAFGSLAFTLDKVSPGSSADAKLISELLLARIGLALVLMAIGRRYSTASSLRAFWLALGTVSLGAIWACIAHSTWEVAASLVLLSCSSLFYTPRLRTLRQELLTCHVADASRTGATGAMISIEACSFLAAAFLMWLFNGDWTGARVSAACLGAAGIALGYFFWKDPKQNTQMPSQQDTNQ